MKISKIILFAAAFVGGIYITSEEGKQVRQVLEKKKSTFKPIINDLLEQANKVLKGSQSIKSSQIRANIDRLVTEAKTTLVEIDLEKTIDKIKEAVRVASKKIREAFNEVEKNQQPKKVKNKVQKTN